MNISRFSPYIVIGLYGFIHAIVLTIGSTLTEEWYREKSRDLNFSFASTFDLKTYLTDITELNAQRKVIIGLIEVGFIILASALIIQYSRSKYFEKSQIDDTKYISGKDAKSLISAGVVGGLSFYILVFLIGLFTADPFSSDTPTQQCSSMLTDLKLCSESFPRYMFYDLIGFSAYIMIFLSFLQLSLVAAIYPTILLIYLSVRKSKSKEMYPLAG
ncbi:MAG: hypothetical protein GPJ54_21690 [Candidatus Heimdallarchaeota archaeon]|nr:hypothetical protein [Candidatus Heimdallarchaeota archaeon]